MAVNTDYNCLLKLTSSALQKFLHHCVDELSGKPSEDFHRSMQDIEWSPEEVAQARNVVQQLFKNSTFLDEFAEDLSALPESHSDEIRRCFALRKQDICQSAIRQQLLRCGFPLVENIDWKLRWVMGSSKLAALNEPLLQIELNCVNNETPVQFEVNLSQLDDLTTKLVDVKAKLIETKSI